MAEPSMASLITDCIVLRMLGACGVQAKLSHNPSCVLTGEILT